MSQGPEYIAQLGGSCCFVYAAVNMSIYLGHVDVDIEALKDMAACRHGATIHRQAVVDELQLPLKETDSHQEVFERGGILTIMHPIFNFHAVFVVPQKKGEVLIVNSWLGPTEVVVGFRELEQFLMLTEVNRKHWVSREKLVEAV